jgi:hypothetical protein
MEFFRSLLGPAMALPTRMLVRRQFYTFTSVAIVELRLSLSSENAMKTQILCAVTYILIAIIKKELQLEAALYTRLLVSSVSVLTDTRFMCLLQTISNPSCTAR